MPGDPARPSSHDPAADRDDTRATQLFSSGNSDVAGRTVGPYRIESRIAAGGMGEVFRAHDSKLDRPVAIKLLAPELASDPDRLRRFHAEARAASSLNHPHILVIHDFGEIDGRPFIVTEFVEGETLRERMQLGPMPLRVTIEVVLQVAHALAAAHARGIVHRDIKPENVMVRPDGYVKVLDFGLAKLAVSGAHEADATLRTRPGMVIGTPRYMSPEQARGADVEATSDVWSLGVMLYELAAGTPPFAGATPADLIAAVLNTEPIPFELQAPAAPPALARIIARALRKDRRERYATAGELAEDLAAVRRQFDSVELMSSPHTASAATPAPSSGVVSRTRVIVMPFRLLRPDPDADFLSFSLADAIATTISGVDSLVVRSTLAATRLTPETLDVRALAEEADVDAVITGTLLSAGRQIRVTAQVVAVPQGTIAWSDRLDVSIDEVFQLQDELSRRIVDALAVPLSTREKETLHRDVPASSRAYELYLRANGQFYKADGWPIARDLLVECVREDPRYAPAWARLGRCYRLTAKFQSASVEEMRENLRRADVAFRKAFELNPDLPLAHQLYTALETDLGRAEDAITRLLQRVRVRRSDPELYAGLVHACRYCGLLDASVAAHERARQLDPQITTSVMQTYWMRGELERASEGASLTGFFIGLPLIELGRHEEAMAMARAAAAVTDPLTRAYHSILPMLLEGRTDECLRLLDELAPRNPDPESIYHVARTYARAGAIDRAVSYFDRAVSMGFFCYPMFVRDSWLDTLRDRPAFIDALARARTRHENAVRLFRDAGGERLLA